MAELATIARPYAEALFQVARRGDLNAWISDVNQLSAIAGDESLRVFADNPKVSPQQVFDVVCSAINRDLSEPVKNFLRTIIDNGRLAVLPEVAQQFHALVNAQSGVADATIYSAFPLDDAALADLLATLEKRFGRKLQPSVQVEPDLIGGVRVVVGDQVIDTSVKARLAQMKVALTA